MAALQAVLVAAAADAAGEATEVPLVTKPIRLPGAPLTDGPTTLRPWRDSDLDALVELCRDPEIVRWTRVPANYSPADGRLYLARRHDMAFAGLLAPFAIVVGRP